MSKAKSRKPRKRTGTQKAAREPQKKELGKEVLEQLKAGNDEAGRTNRRLVILLVILAVLALVLYSCGGVAARKRREQAQAQGAVQEGTAEAPAAEAGQEENLPAGENSPAEEPLSPAEASPAEAPPAEETPAEASAEETAADVSQADGSGSAPAADIPEAETIAMSNYMNQGRNLISGSWIYGMDFDETGASGLYKQKTDGSERTKLSKYFSSFVNIEGGFLYYIGYNQESGGQAVCRMRISGEGEESIALRTKEEKEAGFIFDSFFIRDGFLYYSLLADPGSGEARGSFRRCGPAGEDETEILNRAVKYPYIIGDRLYYIDLADFHRLHCCESDGSNDRVLIDDVVYTYVVDGDFIFYVSADGERTFDEHGRITNGDQLNYQLRLTDREGGSAMILLQSVKSRCFAVNGTYLYYVDRLDGSRLYRLDKATGQIDLLSQRTNVGNLELFGNSLVFFCYSEDWGSVEGIYRAGLDGTGLGTLFAPVQP